MMSGATLRSRYLCCLIIVWGLLVWGGNGIAGSLPYALLLVAPLFILVITLEPYIAAMLDDKPPEENL